MESRGNAPSYPPGGYDTFGSTLHWGPGWTDDPFSLTTKTMKVPVDPTADFHIYGLIWNETYIGISMHISLDVFRYVGYCIILKSLNCVRQRKLIDSICSYFVSYF